MFIQQDTFKDYFSLTEEGREKLLNITIDDLTMFMANMMVQCDMNEDEVYETVIDSLSIVIEVALSKEEYEKIDFVDKIRKRLIDASTNKK